MNSMNLMALALFGAFFASATPEMFTCVPPVSWKVGMITLIASPHWLLLVRRLAHQADVIGVAEGDVADAGEDVAGLLAVAARGLLGEVRLDALQPFLGLRLALVRDHRGDQADIVEVLAGADADLALPLRVGELLIGDLVLLHALLGGIDDAAAQADAEPMALRIAIGRRDRLLEHGATSTGCVTPYSFACCRRPISTVRSTSAGLFSPSAAHALLEAARGEDRVHLDAGLLGELVDERLDQARLAIGVEVDLLGRKGRGGEGRKARCEGRGEGPSGGCERRHDVLARRGSRPRST